MDTHECVEGERETSECANLTFKDVTGVYNHIRYMVPYSFYKNKQYVK